MNTLNDVAAAFLHILASHWQAHLDCGCGWTEAATSAVRPILQWAERLSRYLRQRCANPGSFLEHRPGVWLTLCTDCAVRERGRVGGQC